MSQMSDDATMRILGAPFSMTADLDLEFTNRG